jgi:hypothetical protein
MSPEPNLPTSLGSPKTPETQLSHPEGYLGARRFSRALSAATFAFNNASLRRESD